MDLVELLGTNELQQDEWSLSGPAFGDDHQLKVVGWGIKNIKGERLYIVKCDKCSFDSELFGEGYFKIRRSHLIKSKVLPCGCSPSPRWTKEQYRVICGRSALGLGYTFIDFEGEWKGAFTKIKILCEKHGEWDSGSIHTLTNWATGCPGCGNEAIAAAMTKPDHIMITSFFASGAFHPDTKFWRSERKIKAGWRVYWFVSCPECGEIGESTGGNLQKGKRPCACSHMRQQECYINWVIDDNNMAVAIKFGISRNSKKRVIEQNRSSLYEIRQYAVYKFDTTESCKKSERECLQELECGIVLRRDMEDGWSETTWVYNLEKVIEIYQCNGGVKNED